MHIIIDPKELTQVCEISSFIKSARSASPNKGQLFIKAEGDKVTAIVENLEQMVFIDLKARVIEQGQIFASAKRIKQFAQHEKGKVGIRDSKKTRMVEFYTADHEGDMSLKIWDIGLPEPLPIPTHAEPITLLNPDFRQRALYALQCVSADPSRPILTGVCFSYSNGTLDMVSADGFRMIHIKDTFLSAYPAFEVVIPSQAIALLKYLKGEIKFSLHTPPSSSHPSNICFQSGNIKVISQLINGTYPKWRQLIPSSSPTWSFTTSSPLLCQRLKQLKSDDVSGITRLRNNGNCLSIITRVESIEEAECSLPAENKGNGKIAVRDKYLLECAKIFSEITVGTTNPSSQLMITGDLRDVTVVIMPMFVQW
jgi:DNA polymerase III sliding clamp (beta) subunit (PCNA family)